MPEQKILFSPFNASCYPMFLHARSVVFLFVFFCLTNSNAQEKPNVLIILTDDQGYHDVSYYGTKDIRTPHIDALAADGMRFDNFYANCPVCSPTRASLLSGNYPDQVGVPGVIRTYASDNWGYLDPSISLLPDLLHQRDYHTALIGKWHLGLESPNVPNERGFDYFHGWLGDMMDDYWLKRRHEINYMRENEHVIDPEGHATDLFTTWAIDYIEGRKDQANPFFLYLAYNAPHFPVQPPEDWLEKVKLREPEVSPKRAKLIAFIEHLDHGIGKVIETLKSTGQYENTLIIFTSDNGGLLRDEANNGPLRDGKQSVYEGGLKVPTCVVWNQGKVKASSSTDYRAATMDIFPTVLEAAGLSHPEEMPSLSFLPVLQGHEMSDRDRPLYFVRREGNARYGGLTIQAVLLNEWKLLQNSPFGPQEMYNLAADPLEQHNLRGENPDQFKELNGLMMKFIQAGGQVPWQKPSDK
ncbi:MAG: sulfatase-like hydrolase/transferase [Saprospiraceae bacterium]|nr:sulfatase-like hydrolase/transferase [Saprospiraceae bacterium]